MLKHHVEHYDKERTKVCYEEWTLNGLYHREDGPAFIIYNKDGSISFERYSVNDKRHRLDGPALIRYDEDGIVRYEYYYLNDVLYKKEEWFNALPTQHKIDYLLKG